MKQVYLLLGFLFVGLGFTGIIIPGLPTTPFLLLAAACFFRSNKKWHDWLINHKIFGPFIKDYLEERKIPLRVKIIAISMMSIMIFFSITKIENIFVQMIVIALGLTGAIYILSIKTK